jgi:hypothetical protein
MFIALSLAVALFCGYLCYRFAAWKGRRPLVWMIWGVFFAPLPLFLLLLLPRRHVVGL